MEWFCPHLALQHAGDCIRSSWKRVFHGCFSVNIRCQYQRLQIRKIQYGKVSSPITSLSLLDKVELVSDETQCNDEECLRSFVGNSCF